MPDVKPFRGLRFAPGRVDLAAIVGPVSSPAGGDPRHVRRLLDEPPAADDGRDGPLRRARHRLAEWQRAGILARDGLPALYALRRRDDDGSEALGLFCALKVEEDASAQGARADPRIEARLEHLEVAVEPVIAAFVEPRVRRTLENAVDREADASWKVGRTQLELWCLDDESTAARLATLLSAAAITVEQGRELLASHASFAKKRAAGRATDDDGARADSFALAFLHSAEDAWVDVPVGAALLPLSGKLQ